MTSSLIRFIFGVYLLLTILIASSSAVEEDTPKQILIFASYNPGLKWTDSSGSAIESQISIYYPTASFSVEYMDTKKQVPTEARLAELSELYQNKYKRIPINR